MWWVTGTSLALALFVVLFAVGIVGDMHSLHGESARQDSQLDRWASALGALAVILMIACIGWLVAALVAV